MSATSISRAEFVRRLSLDNDLERFIGKEVEWFADDTGNVIGTIALGSTGWSYVILRRDKLGNFRVCNVRGNLYGLDAARMDIFSEMGAEVRSGREVFPQKD